MDIRKETIGCIGMGQMGGGMAENQLKAGFSLLGYDPAPAAMERFTRAGGKAADSAEQVLAECNVVWVCVPGYAAEKLTPQTIIPNVREDQIIIDHCTIPLPDAKKYAAAITAKGARSLDMPVSGGTIGADSGALRMFAGGDKNAYDVCLPLFHAAGNPDKVDFYGAAGMGQIAKVVQQLTARIQSMARLELLAFGTRAGLTREQLLKALDVDPSAPNPWSGHLQNVDSDDKRSLGVLASEWGYYVKAAHDIGMKMPMLEGAWDFIKDAPKTTADNLNRPMPCWWDELMKAGPAT